MSQHKERIVTELKELLEFIDEAGFVLTAHGHHLDIDSFLLEEKGSSDVAAQEDSN